MEKDEIDLFNLYNFYKEKNDIKTANLYYYKLITLLNSRKTFKSE